jgi:hypothetical protein
MPDAVRSIVETLNAKVFRRAALLRRSVSLRDRAAKHEDRARMLDRAGDTTAAREHRAVADDQRNQAAGDVSARGEN